MNGFRKMAIVFAFCAFQVAFTSCEEPGLGDLGEVTLSEETVVEGLRQALKVGTDTAVTGLNITDGFYKDEAVKIFLPEEAQVVYGYLSYLPTDLVEQNILAINRAAEDAAKEATPIFVAAITDLTIQDGFDILNGDDTAATSYLKWNTYQELYDAFKPKIDLSLNKDLVLGISAEDIYSRLINTYNTASLNGFLFDKITSNSLSEHTTNRALTGLFRKVAEEETLIREDPAHRVTEILERVFAEQD
jgi:hypothetical protein